MDKGTSIFHPLIQQWFKNRFGQPTDVQSLAWPKIARGTHVLITAPTGSGKTLTAFLWALDRLIRGEWERGKVRVLYVSPLKALNNDIQRNLLTPLAELRFAFENAGEPFPEIAVMTRSGDTDPSDRARMLRKPPEILITTPESLNLLVGSMRGRAILTELKTVILDEIHSAAGGKRGTHLIAAVDRLVLLSGEFQRIALSATVRPLERIAQWVGGRRMEERGGKYSYTPRNVDIVDCRQSKQIALRVQYPNFLEKSSGDPTFWIPLVLELKDAIRRNRSTLIFTNNRRTCERISFWINEGEERRIAYAHHGSLSRETRSVVERRLKEGDLAAIVATSSLELGIDIGALDEVLMVQTPPGIASALQRVGRAGHGVGQTSRGVVFPTHGRDLLDAAVICKSMMERDIEEIRPVENPLDLLAQTIVSMSGVEEWDIDRLYAFLQSSAPFFNLRRKEYDLVLAMLGGQYASKRLRHIRPLISIDNVDNTIRAKEGALQKVLMEGGTIPDRGYFALRHRDTRSKIGELDEEFVWERRVGDTFMLGTQVWKIYQITHNDVLALPSDEPAKIAPFWKNEQVNRDFYCAEKIGLFLEKADRDLKRKAFRQSLVEDYALEENAADALIDFLKRQKETTACGLPHRRHLIVEYTHIPGGKNYYSDNKYPGDTGDWRQAILHTGWGGRVNQPLSLIVAAVLEARSEGRIESFANNDGILLALDEELPLAEALLSIQPGDVEKRLRAKLESSGFFGARFRENASRALLTPKGRFGQRTPLWLHRLRSKELLDVVGQFADFPILLETWRTCLRDEFDLDSLRQVLGELQSGEIQISEIHTPVPSPFADSLIWIQTNQFVYTSDAAFSDRQSALREDLIQEIAGSADLRPEISSELIAQLEERLQRRIPGYAPDSATELLDWVKERLLIPAGEWRSLCEVIRKNPDADLDAVLEALSNKVFCVRLLKCEESVVVALECVPRLLAALEIPKDDLKFNSITPDRSSIVPDLKKLLKQRKSDPSQEEESLADWLGQWLTFYGPVSRTFIGRTLGIEETCIEEALETLLDDERIVTGTLRQGSAVEEICDRENLERLLRMKRRQAAPQFSPLPVDTLPLHLAHQQNLTRRGETLEDLQRVLEPLLGYPAPVELWEREFLPARMAQYSSGWIDEIMRDSGLIWYGCGKQAITLCFRDQIDLFHTEESGNDSKRRAARQSTTPLFSDPRGKYDFSQLMEITHLSSAQLTEALWQAAWRGEAGNDSFRSLRMGIGNKFKVWEIPEERNGGRRVGFGRWRASRPFAGYWFALDPPVAPEDSLEELERQKERVRLLVDRYGILFRELLARELPALRWGALFKAMRIMELSGELVGGYFFEGVAGAQFIRPAALRVLQEGIPQDAVYWMNAADPASPCGLSLDGLNDLPPRRLSNYLVYHGKNLVMVVLRQGKELDLRVEPNHPDLPAYFSLFTDWMNRFERPVQSIAIETINSVPAAKSPYLGALRELFNVVDDYKRIVARKRYE